MTSWQAITSKPKQNTDFLMDIQRRGPKAFGILIKSLCATHQEHCADWLDPQREIARPPTPISSSSTQLFQGQYPRDETDQAGQGYYPICFLL